MLQSLVSIHDSYRATLEATLRGFNSRKIEERQDWTEFPLRKSYDAVAQVLADSGEVLSEEALSSRIPGLVFEVALEFRWLSLDDAERSPFYGPGPINYVNPPVMPDPAAALGTRLVQETFKVWFLARLEGRIEYWRGFVVTKFSAEIEKPFPTAGSATSRGLETRSGAVPEPTTSSPRVRNGRKGGRRVDPERRAAIRKAILAHGEPWREHLSDVFEELDREEVALGNFQSIKIDLGEEKPMTVVKWSDLDLADGDQRRGIIDRLRKYRNE